MSLLIPVRGSVPLPAADPAAVAAATRRICEELLAWNRLRASDVVVARFACGSVQPEVPLQAARTAGWTGIPLFVTCTEGAADRLEVEAHVRVRRRRRLRPLELS